MAGKAILILTVAAALGACSRTDDGKIVVNRPGEVQIKTTQDTINPPSVEVGTRKDTVTVPTVEVNKKKTEVTTPTVRVKP